MATELPTEDQIERAKVAYTAYVTALEGTPESVYVGGAPWLTLGTGRRLAWIKMVNDVYEQGRVDEQFSTE